jgi:hypothetical protein
MLSGSNEGGGRYQLDENQPILISIEPISAAAVPRIPSLPVMLCPFPFDYRRRQVILICIVLM